MHSASRNSSFKWPKNVSGPLLIGNHVFCRRIDSSLVVYGLGLVFSVEGSLLRAWGASMHAQPPALPRGVRVSFAL